MGGAGQLHIEAVRKEHVKIQPQKKALGQHPAAVLDLETEILGQTGIGKYDGLAEERAVFRAADVEYVAQPGQVGKGYVVSFGAEGGAQARSVQKEQKAVFMAQLRDGLQLGPRIDRPQLRRIGEVY